MRTKALEVETVQIITSFKSGVSQRSISVSWGKDDFDTRNSAPLFYALEPCIDYFGKVEKIIGHKIRVARSEYMQSCE